MYEIDPYATARMIFEDRVREADHQRLVRELHRTEPASTAGPTSQQAQRHSRLWNLVHLRHAYS